MKGKWEFAYLTLRVAYCLKTQVKVLFSPFCWWMITVLQFPTWRLWYWTPSKGFYKLQLLISHFFQCHKVIDKETRTDIRHFHLKRIMNWCFLIVRRLTHRWDVPGLHWMAEVTKSTWKLRARSYNMAASTPRDMSALRKALENLCQHTSSKEPLQQTYNLVETSTSTYMQIVTSWTLP